MESNRIGRVLGIGARVAGAKLRAQADRLGSAPGTAAPGPAGAPAGAAASRPSTPGTGSAQDIGARVGAGVRQAAQNFRASQVRSAEATRGAQAAASGASTAETAGTQRLARGAGRFGAAFFRPFAHASSQLWNEITGIFFALFAVFFIEHTWMVYRAAHWRDRHVFLYGGLALLFIWFAASTFWRVRRNKRRG